jgi:adenylylsulfate kinase-like enzyme
MVRELVAAGEFVEIHVDTPLEVCKQRDPKGLYARALEGKIKNFTGIDSPYEPPEHPEIVVDTSQGSAEDVAARIVAALRDSQIIS